MKEWFSMDTQIDTHTHIYIYIYMYLFDASFVSIQMLNVTYLASISLNGVKWLNQYQILQCDHTMFGGAVMMHNRLHIAH